MALYTSASGPLALFACEQHSSECTEASAWQRGQPSRGQGGGEICRSTFAGEGTEMVALSWPAWQQGCHSIDCVKHECQAQAVNLEGKQGKLSSKQNRSWIVQKYCAGGEVRGTLQLKVVNVRSLGMRTSVHAFLYALHHSLDGLTRALLNENLLP